MDSQLLLFEPWPVRERISLRARRIRVDVRPDGEVVLTIPRRASHAAAREFLQRSQDWIARTRARLLAAAPQGAALRWDGTDTLMLRGARLALRVETVSGLRARTSLEPDAMVLHAPARWRGDVAKLRRLLLGGLHAEAEHDARRLLDEESARLGLAYSGLSLRDTRSRWGSCGADGRIMLSLRLIMAPPEVFRYVVIHELCHLRWRGHGPRFWALVARRMPEYREHRAWLRQHGARLLALNLRLNRRR